jgi:hypothetical protein
MTAYTVNVYPPDIFRRWYATVDRASVDIDPRGTGSGSTEREAACQAWSEYWRKADR